MVGPEGGFTDQEVDELLAEGGQAVSLGESVLRVETAGVALLAALRLCHQPGPGR
jgi:16S rRNA (uracil1498-N3)-methyltransferase